VKVLRPLDTTEVISKLILPSQSLGVVLKKLNITQQKQTTQERNSLS